MPHPDGLNNLVSCLEKIAKDAPETLEDLGMMEYELARSYCCEYEFAMRWVKHELAEDRTGSEALIERMKTALSELEKLDYATMVGAKP